MKLHVKIDPNDHKLQMKGTACLHCISLHLYFQGLQYSEKQFVRQSSPIYNIRVCKLYCNQVEESETLMKRDVVRFAETCDGPFMQSRCCKIF